MKGKIKKNQIVITTLALMIAIAGYLDFAGTEIETETTLTEGVVDDSEVVDTSDISMEDAYALQEEVGETEILGASTEDGEELIEQVSSTEDIESYDFDLTSTETGEVTAEATEEEVPGEAVFTSGSASGVADIVSEAKLTREQVRSKNKEALLEVINNTNISDDQKQEAIDNMIALTDLAEKVTFCLSINQLMDI